MATCFDNLNGKKLVIGLVHLLPMPGINVNAKDKNGKTPLQLAEEQGHTECAELLRAAGGR